MRTAGTPLLEGHPVFHSRDGDRTRAFLGAVGFSFTPDGESRGLHDARINGVYFPNIYLGYVQYGTATRIRTTPMRTDYWLQLPLSGGIEIGAGRHLVTCDTRTAVLGSPSREHIIVSDAGSARCQVSLTGRALQQHLACLLGETPAAPLDMALSIDLQSGYGQKLSHYLNLALADFERHGASRWNAVAMTEFEQVLMTLLLLEHPHNYSDRLARLARPLAPRAVKRAVDYMHANLAMPMTLADIVANSGVAGRTLFEHFRLFKGTSPMRYLREARLLEARRALTRAEPGASITEIAMRWGFVHLGRFALDYRRRFGETPRTTLANARTSRGKPAAADAAARRRELARPDASLSLGSLDPRYNRFG